ncbi:hypothetical protein PVK06_007636 [Gossypium arboreum]|uniref:DUF4283 domain-containing protein n=1 Tax=Gossypium arboreum TaxID=29729 RepID=A0ABR0QHT4_GOSAR|nr:hypothetical protein PVK06_007636 [Gossypium arboreum]
MAWIRLSGLPGLMYKKKILEAIGGMIGTMEKLDFQTNRKIRGRFAQMVVLIILDKPLISQVKVNSEVQLVEYEGLPTICFSYGMGSVDVPLNSTVFDPEKHSTVTIKENSNPNKSMSSSVNVTIE